MTLSGKAKLAGIIGWPVAHSLSPRLHGYWLSEYGIDGAYVPLPVAPENIGEALKSLPKLGFAGVNVTVPHKEAAMRAIDELDDNAMRLGAVNTIEINEGGGLVGRNTDGFGFIENLRAGAPLWQPGDGPAVVLGAGGASRAVVAALLDAGVPEIRLINRTLARAEVLAADIGGPIHVIPWSQASDAFDGAGLLTNTTTLGMTGHAPLDVELARLPGTAVVNDIVYNPLRTPLLEQADVLGLKTVDGLGMLLHQARPGFAAWFGHQPEVNEGLRAHVLAGLHGREDKSS